MENGVWLGVEPAGLHFFTGHSGIWRQDIVSLQARYGLLLARHRFAVDKSLFAGVVSEKPPEISASQELPRLQAPGRVYKACSRAWFPKSRRKFPRARNCRGSRTPAGTLKEFRVRHARRTSKYFRGHYLPWYDYFATIPQENGRPIIFREAGDAKPEIQNS